MKLRPPLLSHSISPRRTNGAWIRSGGGGLILLVLIGLLAVQVSAQIPTVLTDKIYQGQGTINLLKDISGTNLTSYLQSNGSLLLAVDVNENEAGNESRASLGIALKNVSLLITTSTGSFSFSDVFTNTTALIREAGATQAAEYYTLFGQSGSSQLTGATTASDLSSFDDVLQIRNVNLSGAISSAQLVVTFLNTGTKNLGANESFFDFSGGFEDFAILSAADANILEAAAKGLKDAPTTLNYTDTVVASTFYSPPMETTTSASPIQASPTPVISPVPGAPVPPLGVVVAVGVLLLLRARRVFPIRYGT